MWGNATASYNPYEASRILTVGPQSGSRVIDETKQRFIYEPGKSFICIFTGQFGEGVPGITKIISYGGHMNALGFCQSGSSFGIIKRNQINDTTLTETFVSQSDWNLDKFDGSGPSKKYLDNKYCQIYFIDMEWLGIGRVRYGIYQGGTPYYVHEFSHINELNYPYLGNPNLPLRFEIVNMNGSTTSSSMRHICTSVISEGGSDNLGILKTIDTNNSISVPGLSKVGLLFLRPITGSSEIAFRFCATKISPTYVSILPTANVALKWQVLLNPTVNNSQSLSYTPYGGFGAEYATGSSTTNIINDGNVIMTGFIPASTNQIKTESTFTLDQFFWLGADLYDNRDTIVLAVSTLQNTTCPTYAALGFREIV